MEAKELMMGDLIRYLQDQCLTDEDKAPLTVTCVGEPEYPDYMPFVKIKGSNEKYHQDLFEPNSKKADLTTKETSFKGNGGYQPPQKLIKNGNISLHQSVATLKCRKK